MADFVLTLGGVTFKKFEIPEQISAGGGQTLATHKYGSGLRTVDAFGPDDDPIEWSGIFFDEDAEPRCQQLDTMRRQGAPVDLSWSSFSYQVVIKSFKFESERFYQIRYSITLEVVQDNTQPSSDGGDDLESDIQDDLSDMSDFADQIGSDVVDTAVDAVNAVTQGLSSVVGASLSGISSLSDAVSGALSATEGVTDQIDDDLDNSGQSGLFASGTSPDAMVANLTVLTSDTGQMSTAFALSNTLGRLAKNVASISGT